MNEPDYRTLLGGYVSNILDDNEQAAVELHLADCAECRQELADMAEAARLLTAIAGQGGVLPVDNDQLDIALLEAEGARLDNNLILAKTIRAVRSERSRARRPGLVAAAATIAILLVGGGVAGAVIHGRSPSAAPAISQPAGGRTFAARDSATGVHITVTVIPQKMGFSRLSARLTYEPAHAHCQLITIARNGQQRVASSWAVGPNGSGARGTQVAGSVAIPATEIRTIEVRTLSGKHIVSVSTR